MKNKEQKSSCCQSSVRVKGEVTHFYSCDNCGKPCDVSSKEVSIKKETKEIDQELIKKLDIFLANLNLNTKDYLLASELKDSISNRFSTLRQSVLEEVREKMPKKVDELIEVYDNSSHRYKIPISRIEDWQLWLTIDEEDDRSWVAPSYSERIDGEEIIQPRFNDCHDQVISLINNLIEEK